MLVESTIADFAVYLGMFLYAELVFANLLSCVLLLDLVQELRCIPKGLDEA